jgi:hypothetical protein
MHSAPTLEKSRLAEINRVVKALRRRDGTGGRRGLTKLNNFILMDDMRKKWAILDRFFGEPSVADDDLE